MTRPITSEARYCIECNGPVVARGRCMACYHRLRRAESAIAAMGPLAVPTGVRPRSSVCTRCGGQLYPDGEDVACLQCGGRW